MTTKDADIQQFMREFQYWKDRQAVLDVVMKQSRGHDRHDAELMTECFFDDGVDEHGPFVTAGLEYGEWANTVHSQGFISHHHHIASHSCEIDGDTAHCESYVIGTMLPNGDRSRGKLMIGRYVDRLERRDGEWRIVVRRTVIEMELEGDATWGGAGPVTGDFPKGTWDTSDVSYARPLQLDTPSARWDGTTR